MKQVTKSVAKPRKTALPTDPELRTVLAAADTLLAETSGMPAAPLNDLQELAGQVADLAIHADALRAAFSRIDRSKIADIWPMDCLGQIVAEHLRADLDDIAERLNKLGSHNGEYLKARRAAGAQS